MCGYTQNHRKCQKVHSGIASDRQGFGQSRTLTRHYCKKTRLKKARGYAKKEGTAL